MKKVHIFFLLAAMLTSPIALGFDKQLEQEKIEQEEDRDRDLNIYEEMAFIFVFYLFATYMID